MVIYSSNWGKHFEKWLTMRGWGLGNKWSPGSGSGHRKFTGFIETPSVHFPSTQIYNRHVHIWVWQNHRVDFLVFGVNAAILGNAGT